MAEPTAAPGFPLVGDEAPGLQADAMAAMLAAGEVALLPTDTLPALAVLPAHAARIWSLKLRPVEKPLILMGDSLDQLVQFLGVGWRQEWLEQAHRCWPGPVTLVLPILGITTRSLNPTGGSLGLRVPACDAIRDVLRLSGPLATTSANCSGEPPALSRREAVGRFPELPALASAAWPEGSGLASAVLAWRAHGDTGSWQTLRAGASKRSESGHV